MSESIKEAVLAKCLELAPEQIRPENHHILSNGWRVFRYRGGSSLWWHVDHGNDGEFNFNETTPTESPIWIHVTQILGIQVPTERPILDQNGYYSVVGGGHLADIFNACKAQLDGPYPSTQECVATIRRIQNWAREAINQPNGQQRPNPDPLEADREEVYAAWLDGDIEINHEAVNRHPEAGHALMRLCGKEASNG